MKVLIDCGAYTGDSLLPLIELHGPFDRIVCFEANPSLVVIKPDIFDGKFEVCRSAVWTQDTELPFFFGEHSQQSSLLENKTTGNLSIYRSAIVNAIDFPKWIDVNTSSEDVVTLKIDIEGAEFDVLERLAVHAARKRVRMLLVEWHNNRLKPRWRYGIRRRLLELRYGLMGLPIRVWRRKTILRSGVVLPEYH